LAAFYLHESHMNIAFSGFDHVHLLGESATHPIRPPSGALAALQILAIPPGIAAVCALPAHPMTTCSGASNYRF
jgi:hypothetical protein